MAGVIMEQYSDNVGSARRIEVTKQLSELSPFHCPFSHYCFSISIAVKS